MNPEITPEQKQQLDSWSKQRDAILGEISVLRIESEKLIKNNENLAAANTDIQEKINQSLGRLDEMTKKEEEFGTLTDVKIVELSSQKAVLESKIEDLNRTVILLERQKDSLENTIRSLTDVSEKVFSQTSSLEKNVEDARKISSENLTETNNLLIALKGEFQKLIDINAENVKRTNVVINDLPRIIFDLQKNILERRTINKHQI